MEQIDTKEEQVKEAADNYTFEELEELIEELGITQIVSYDDEWNKLESKSIQEVDLNPYLEMNLSNFKEEKRLRIEAEEENIIRNAQITTVQQLLDAENPELEQVIKSCNRILQRIKSQSKDDLNLKALESLKEILDKLKERKKIGYVTRTEPYSETEQFTDIDHEARKGRFLFVLDIEMGKTEEEVDTIVESLLKINNSRKDKFDLVIVLSHSNLDVYENFQTKLSYVKSVLKQIKEKQILEKCLEDENQEYLLPRQLWAFQKKNKVDDLLASLIETIRESAFGHSLHDYLLHEIKNKRKAMLKLISTPEEQFDFLYKDCFIEGELFTDVLKRVSESIYSEIEYSAWSDSESEYKKIVRNVLVGANNKNERFLKEIREQELNQKKRKRELDYYRKKILEEKIENGSYKGTTLYGLIDYSVNARYANIMTGDIFRFLSYEKNKELFGILITPSCDLMVRYQDSDTNEDAIDRKVRDAILVLYKRVCLTELETKQCVDNLHNVHASGRIWPIKSIDSDERNQYKYYYLEPYKEKDLKIISTKILDLCSLNGDGWANLNYDLGECKEYKTEYFNKYTERAISQFVDEVYNLDKYYEGSLLSGGEIVCTKIEEISGIQDVRNGLCEIFAGLKYSISLNLQGNRFEIQRIGRLKKDVTLELIQKKYSNSSRPGSPTTPFMYASEDEIS